MCSQRPYGEDIVVEIVAKGTTKIEKGQDISQERSECVGVVAAYDEVYEEEKEDRMFQLVESPALKVISVLLKSFDNGVSVIFNFSRLEQGDMAAKILQDIRKGGRL